MCRIGDVCCLPVPAHQPFSPNSLDLSAPKEAYSRNASGILKFGYEGVLKIQIICEFLEALIGNGATMFTSISYCKSMGIFDCHASRVLVQSSKLRICCQIILK